jgi:hypothetical protein
MPPSKTIVRSRVAAMKSLIALILLNLDMTVARLGGSGRAGVGKRA